MPGPGSAGGVLRESVLEQLDLEKLAFAVEPGGLPEKWAEAVALNIEEVFGSSSAVVQDGDYQLGKYFSKPWIGPMRCSFSPRICLSSGCSGRAPQRVSFAQSFM